MTRHRSSKGNRRPPSPVPTCKICLLSRQNWTKEDAYPQWLRARIRDWYSARPDGPQWAQVSRVFLRPVCEPCQERLNELFEQPTSELLKTMLEGPLVSLSPRRQALLAGWAVKTGLVLA